MAIKPATLLFVGALLVLAAGCGNADESADSVGADFAAAVERGNGKQACRLLAPSTAKELVQSTGRKCPVAVLKEMPKNMGRSLNQEVYGGQAQIEFENDTAFLAQFDGAWKIVAAGCRPRGERPYDCAVKGA